jgi:hypothetical protein
MRRAIEANDRMMIRAIARQAHANGWVEVATAGPSTLSYFSR